MDTNKFYLQEGVKENINYFRDLFKEKLDLYHYCESQLSRVAFANSIFIAAIAVLNKKKKIVYNTYTVMLFFPFLVSLIITLFFTIPKFFMPCKKYKVKDHRSIYGIKNLGKIEDYKKHISELTPEKTCDEIIAQIHNMNDTIILDYKGITIAVILDIIGMIAFIVFLINGKLLSC
jgi:hypothetical protein